MFEDRLEQEDSYYRSVLNALRTDLASADRKELRVGAEKSAKLNLVAGIGSIAAASVMYSAKHPVGDIFGTIAIAGSAVFYANQMISEGIIDLLDGRRNFNSGIVYDILENARYSKES